MITVEGVQYRWRVRDRPTYSQGALGASMSIAIELAENPGAPLVVDTSRAHLRNWFGNPSDPVTPSEVSGYIRQGIELGWEPTQQGPVFEVEAEAA